MTNSIGVLLVLGAILLFIIIYRGNLLSKESYPMFSTDFVTVGTPPPLGDYLPTVGEVKTGDEDHVMMSSIYGNGGASWIEADLCQECVNNCMSYPDRFGFLEGANRVKCIRRCNVECNPLLGL